MMCSACCYRCEKVFQHGSQNDQAFIECAAAPWSGEFSSHCAKSLVLKAHSSDTISSMPCYRICWIQQHRCRHLCSDARPLSPSRARTLRPSPASILQLKPKLPQLQVLLAVNPHIAQDSRVGFTVAVTDAQLLGPQHSRPNDFWQWHADIHSNKHQHRPLLVFHRR